MAYLVRLYIYTDAGSRIVEETLGENAVTAWKRERKQQFIVSKDQTIRLLGQQHLENLLVAKGGGKPPIPLSLQIIKKIRDEAVAKSPTIDLRTPMRTVEYRFHDSEVVSVNLMT